MRPRGAALEPRGNARARERVLEKARVALRRPDEHRHLVEGDTARRFFQHAACDFNAFAAFTGCGEKTDVVMRGPCGRALLREEISAQRDEVALPFLLENLR